jgi:hypothetical protein
MAEVLSAEASYLSGDGSYLRNEIKASIWLVVDNISGEQMEDLLNLIMDDVRGACRHCLSAPEGCPCTFDTDYS